MFVVIYRLIIISAKKQVSSPPPCWWSFRAAEAGCWEPHNTRRSPTSRLRIMEALPPPTTSWYISSKPPVLSANEPSKTCVVYCTPVTWVSMQWWKVKIDKQTCSPRAPCATFMTRAWRVPATRPDPNFFATWTRPELFFKMSEFRVFPSRLFPSRPLQIFLQ